MNASDHFFLLVVVIIAVVLNRRRNIFRVFRGGRGRGSSALEGSAGDLERSVDGLLKEGMF